MIRKIISGLFLFSLLITAAFAHTAKIETSGENKYKSIRLTPEIYSAANKDLSDILIKNSKGENVPYFINTWLRSVSNNHEKHPMTLIDSYIKDDYFYFDYKKATMSESDTVATAIRFTTGDTVFAKLVDIYGSYDNINWEFIQNDRLYAVDEKSKLDIEFNHQQKYTHYRLKLNNNLEKISFNSVDLIYDSEKSEEIYFIESLNPKFSIKEIDKKTHIEIEGLKNLRLYEVEIVTDSMFKRNINPQFGNSKEIYNLEFNGSIYSDTILPLNRQISQDSIYTITITDNDDKPININGITVRYYADEIVFEGREDENYILNFGADSTKTAPVYDIEKYMDEVLNEGVDKTVIGTINYDKVEIPKEKDYKTVFNIVVIIITALLGGLVFLHLRRKTE